jgi:hypothetical protein
MSRKRKGTDGRCDFDLGTSANVSAEVDLVGRLLSEFNGIVQELVVKELSTKGRHPRNCLKILVIGMTSRRAS